METGTDVAARTFLCAVVMAVFLAFLLMTVMEQLAIFTYICVCLCMQCSTLLI